MLDRSILNGWPLLWVFSGLLLIMSAALLALCGLDPDGYRLVIRVTARTSLALFLGAFLASTLVSRWPGPFSDWLLRNRRAFGLGFVMSHAIHLLAIVTFARTDWETFWSLSSTGAIVAGSIAYAVIGLLAATSFDAMVGWLGVIRWKRIHRIGLWFIWMFFVFTNAKRIPDSAWYGVPVAILLGAMILRLNAKPKRTATSTPKPAAPVTS